MVIMDEMSKYYCKFMNFLTAQVYNVLFQEKLPRVLPEMKELLQLSHEIRVGDWFLSKHNILIRVYGFAHQPHVLPAFLTVRVFALELKQRLIVEYEHFLRYKKPSGIKFPWKVGSLSIKSKAALPAIKNIK